MRAIAPADDKRMQVASGVVYKRREEVIRDAKRQYECIRGEVIREEKRREEKRRDNECDCTWEMEMVNFCGVHVQ